MSLKKRIILNAGSNWASMFVSALVGLIQIPVMLHWLGVKNYGIWALLSYGLAYPMLLDRSFSLSINRFVAFYRNDIKEMNRVISASFAVLMGMAVLTIAVMILLSFYLSDIFRAIPAEMAVKAQITCILVGITLGFNMIMSNFIGALRGFQYYTRSNGIVITCNIVRTILIIAMLALWRSIIAVQMAYVVAAALSALLMYIVARNSIPGLRIDLRLVNKKVVLELWRYTSHSIARSGSMIIMFQTLTLLVGWKGTATDVTIYDVASKLPTIIRSLLGGAQNVFLPVATSFWASGEIEKIKAIVKKATQMCFVLTGISATLLFVLTRDILTFWIGANVSEEMISVMRILIISVVPSAFFGTWLPVLVGMGYLRGLSIAAVLGACGAIVVALAFMHGIVSVPMAPALSMAIVLWIYRGVWLPLYGISKLNITVYEYFRTSIAQPLVASLVSVAALWFLNGHFGVQNIHWVFKSIIFAMTVTVSFAAISLRQEVADAVVFIKKSIWGREGK